MIYARYGEIWMRTSMPRDLKKAVESRFHLLNNFHHYIFLVIGVTRDGKKHITEATTFENPQQYKHLLQSIPMVVEHHTHKVYGKLAARHGIWQVQRMNWRHRGLLNPPRKEWDIVCTGSYHQCKVTLHYLTRRNKKNIATFHYLFRLNLVGTLRKEGLGNYRVQMGDTGDYFLRNVPFYGKNYLSSQPENKKKRKENGRKYYNNKLGIKDPTDVKTREMFSGWVWTRGTGDSQEPADERPMV